MLIKKKGATLGVLEVHNFRGGFHSVLHLELISLFKMNQSSLIEKIKVPYLSNYINFKLQATLG